MIATDPAPQHVVAMPVARRVMTTVAAATTITTTVPRVTNIAAAPLPHAIPTIQTATATLVHLRVARLNAAVLLAMTTHPAHGMKNPTARLDMMTSTVVLTVVVDPRMAAVLLRLVVAAARVARLSMARTSLGRATGMMNIELLDHHELHQTLLATCSCL